MNNINIRSANKSDCAGITALTNELGYPSSFEKISEILDLVLKHDDHQVFVAEKDVSIVGYIHLVCALRIGSDPFVEISALIVHDRYRKQGVGKSLLLESEKWAKDKGYSYIRIRSNILRENAHRYFMEKGYQNLKTQQVFLKQLNF